MYGLPFTLGIVDNMGTNREKRKAMACAMTFQFVFAVLLSRNTCYCCTTIFEIYKISCFYIIICTIIVSVYFYFYITFRFSEFRCINNTAFCSIRLRFDSSCLTIIIEYSCAVTPQIRQTGNRLSGNAGTAYASLLA